MDYVSCSPYRVPIARLAAAQAVLAGKTKSAGTSKPAAVKGAGKKPAKSSSASKKSPARKAVARPARRGKATAKKLARRVVASKQPGSQRKVKAK